MSNHDESIYNLIPQPKAVAERSAMHRSKYPADTPPTASTFGISTASTSLVTNLAGEYECASRVHRHKQPHAHFGPKNLHYSDVTSYLKKQTQPTLPEPQPFRYTTRTKPLLDTKPVTSTATATSNGSTTTASTTTSPGKTTKNFIHQNALSAIMAVARKPNDTTINYLNKSDYGHTPEYLQQVKEEIRAEREYIRQMMARDEEEQLRYQPKLKLLPEEDREKLLLDLKNKWEAVNKSYQSTTHLVNLDTIGKVRRKEEYEKQLEHLERSIEKLSKKFVFVHDG